jgi:hypothetical protein
MERELDVHQWQSLTLRVPVEDHDIHNLFPCHWCQRKVRESQHPRGKTHYCRPLVVRPRADYVPPCHESDILHCPCNG